MNLNTATARQHAAIAALLSIAHRIPAADVRALDAALTEAMGLAPKLSQAEADNAVLLGALRRLLDAIEDDEYAAAYAAAARVATAEHPGKALLEEREAWAALLTRANYLMGKAEALHEESLATIRRACDVAEEAVLQRDAAREEVEWARAARGAVTREAMGLKAVYIDPASPRGIKQQMYEALRPEVRVYEAVERRGYVRGWLPDELIARQLVKLVEEVCEAAAEAYLDSDGGLDEDIARLQQLARSRFNDRDGDAWATSGPVTHPPTKLIDELADVQVVLCCLAVAIGNATGQRIDLMQLAVAKAERDEARGVRSQGASQDGGLTK